MRQLLIHADDFGLTEGVTRGILRSIHQGVVTGTSAMLCIRRDDLIRDYAVAIPGRIGLHLQLTGGRPLSDPTQIPTLVGSEGLFPTHRSHITQPSTAEVLLEFRAQWRALTALGVQPAYLDTHHHVHQIPSVFEAYLQLAAEMRAPARGLQRHFTPGELDATARLRAAGVPCADAFLCVWTTGTPTLQTLLRALKVQARLSPPDAILELGCHPGLSDEELTAISRYSVERPMELEILTDPATSQAILDAGWQLASLATLISPQ